MLPYEQHNMLPFEQQNTRTHIDEPPSTRSIVTQLFKRNLIPTPPGANHFAKRRSRVSTLHDVERAQKFLAKIEKKFHSNSIRVVTDFNPRSVNQSNATAKSRDSRSLGRVNKEIGASIVARVERDYNFTPQLGVRLKCTVRNKRDIVEGTLEYLGTVDNLKGRPHVIVAGLRLDGERERATDGMFLGKRYFKTAPKRSYFVPFKNCL